MPKTKTAFFCQNCGHESPKWMGRCPNCNEWNTFIEEIVVKNKKEITAFSRNRSQKVVPQAINEIKEIPHQRIQFADGELNRVLGGGLVPGSLILFGGEPGIGKSTLLLQMAMQEKEQRILYVSGEESEQQIRMRAGRIGQLNENCYILTETQLENVFQQTEKLVPTLLIIDSIQTIYTERIESSPGSISQIKESTAQLLKFAKQTDTSVFLIGHITKEGVLAGPKMLEHMVDTVLQFEGDRNHVYRLLRSIKNRFGSTNELGIYEMLGNGLRQVENPSEILISQNQDQLSGSAIAATLEGLRPMLIEVQALVSSAAYGTPQRSATGFDTRRLNMLLAVMEKRCGFKLATKDVFLNIAGGLKVDDPAIDLAVVAAILSSNADIAIPKNICLSAEVGLSGEIRPVNRAEQRIIEAEKLGFKKIIIAKDNKGINSKKHTIEIIRCSQIVEVLRSLFG